MYSFYSHNLTRDPKTQRKKKTKTDLAKWRFSLLFYLLELDSTAHQAFRAQASRSPLPASAYPKVLATLTLKRAEPVNRGRCGITTVRDLVTLISNLLTNLSLTLTQGEREVRESFHSGGIDRNSGMGLVDLFLVSCMPVLKLLLVSAVGAFLAFDRVNLLGEDARKHLNNVVFYVFSPSLIATNLAKTVTLDSLTTLWFMPLNVLLTFVIGSAFGWIVIKITRAPSHLRGLIVGCCSAGNLGNLLLIIIPAVCKEKASPFGDPDQCHSVGMAYASLSMAVGAVYIWLYVYNIMRICSSKNNAVEVDISIHDRQLPGDVSKVFPDSCKEPLLPSESLTISTEFQNQLALQYDRSNVNVEVPFFVKFNQHLKGLEEKVNFKRLFAPSTIGAIIGFFAGVVPQIRNLLIGESAILRVIQDSASLLSDGAVPVLTLILGGNLLKGLKGPGIQMSLIIGIIVVRYVILPMSGVLIIKTAIHFGLINSDPLYHFVLLLQFALPPAMNIGVISQLFGEGMSECSVIMLWTYALAPLSLTLWSTVFMWFVS